MSSEDDRWTYGEAGPVSRPYTVTGGRTRPRGTQYFDLVDMVVRSAGSADTSSFSPERSRILDLCRVLVSVAEVSAIIGLPLGVVRVLLDDLLNENLIEVMASAPRGGVVTDQRLLRRVLEGLRALLAGRQDLVGQPKRGAAARRRPAAARALPGPGSGDVPGLNDRCQRLRATRVLWSKPRAACFGDDVVDGRAGTCHRFLS